MARLEWNNVAAPSFAGIADNYRTMSDLLSRAAGSTKGMFDIFANAQQNAADQAIMQRMLGATDAATFDPTAILGADGSRASMGMLQNLNRQADTLINREGARLGQQVTRDNHKWTQQGREQVLQFSEPMRRALAAAGSGDTTALAGNDFAGMRADVYSGFLSDGLSAATSDMGLRTSKQRLDESIYNFNELKLDDDTRRRADAVLHDLWTNSYDGASALTRFGELTKGMEPRVVQALRNRLASIYPAQFGFSPSASGIPSAGTGTGTGGGGGGVSAGSFNFDAPRQAVATGLSGLTSRPEVIAGFLGNFEVEGGYGGAQGDGGSAAGIVQWRGERRDNFRRIIGKDPTEATPEEQMRFVQWEFENPVKSGGFVGTKDGLNPTQQRDAILNADTPEKAAELIDRYYERSNGAHRDRRITAAASAFQALNPSATPLQVNNSIRDVVRADDMANSAGVSERLVANMGKRRAPHVVAKEIAASFPDTSETALQRGITNLMAELQITADQAAELMLQNRPAMERSGINPASWRWLGGNKFDLDTDISGAGGRNAVGSMLQTAAANQSRAEVVQLTEQLASQIAGVDQQIELVRQRINALGEQPGLVRSLQELLMQRQQLIGKQQALGRVQRGTQDFTSDDLALVAEMKEQENLQKLMDRGLFWRMPRSEEAIQQERTRRMIQALERSKL